MITNRNRQGSVNVDLPLFRDEPQYWEYVFLTLNGHRFTDEEIDLLIQLLYAFIKNPGHSLRKHVVEIQKKLAYGEFKSEEEFWSFVLSKEIDFSDHVLESFSEFMIKYSKLNPSILSADPEWFEKEFYQ